MRRSLVASLLALFGVLGLLVTVFGATPAESPAARPKATEAEQLVFLLQYIGGDYGAAVQGGRIVDESEYKENREFALLVAERFARLRSDLPPAKVAVLEAAVRRLGELIAARADARLVRQVTESAIPPLLEAFALRSFPRERPDHTAAGRLYAENCAPCHGEHGGGDGPRAKDLDPPPARFTERSRMDSTAPYVFYNAITLGVANTPMASFSDAFSDQQRWDLAFYLWSFLVPDRSPSAEMPAMISLRDLATRSSLELAPQVIRQAAGRGRTIGEPEATSLIAQLRAEPPVLSDAEERLARLRQDLAKSIASLEQGDTEGATDLVTNAYLSEFEPLEPEIDRRDAAVRQDFERGLIEFRAALRRDDRQGAMATARALEVTVDRAASLLETRRSGAVTGSKVAAAALIAVAIAVGILVMRRIGSGGGVS